MKCNSKIVVFDLDETLGYFMELGMFWDALKGYIKHKQLNKIIDQNLFNKVLDLYPEFLRPNIIVILNYLKNKKDKNHCDKLMIYTNNQGPVEWANYIMKYFEKKVNYKIFDQIVAAFKVQGKRVELGRTTHMKTHNDFIKCTKIAEDTQICFLDDVFYPDMSNENIYYINIKPYIYDLDFNDMITRCLNSDILDSDIEPTLCRSYILEYMKRYNHMFVSKTQDNHNVDKILSKKILEHLHIFFKIKSLDGNVNSPNKSNSTNKPNSQNKPNSPSKTKRKKNIHNKTLKKRNM